MSTESINNQRVITPTTQTDQSSSSKSKTAGKNELSMDDFFSLMVSQLSNQDMYNTVDNTQFIAQMAQFSMVKALNTMISLNENSAAANATNYGVSLIGKEVTIAFEDEDGQLYQKKGVVDRVNLFNGKTELVVDGKSYDLSNVMSVSQPKATTGTEDK